MIGRAGRPQFDKFGKAVVMVHDIKKEYYKKFLYQPFPIESSLPSVFACHLNAEVCAETSMIEINLTLNQFYLR